MEPPPPQLARDTTHILSPEEHLPWNDGRWGLLVSLCPQDSADVVLSKDEVTVGRDPTSAVFVADERVSARHCRIFRKDRLAYVCDHSANGTFLNGLRVQRDVPVTLSHGDEISLAVPSGVVDKPLGFVFHDLTLRKRKSALLLGEDKELKKTLSISDILRNEMGMINQISASAPQPAFWEVDEAALVQCVGGVSAITEGDCYRLISLKPPHVADTSVAATEFKKAELAFRRFVNRDRVFSVTQVDVIISPMVEERFKRKERELLERSKTPAKQQTFSPQQQRSLAVLQESVYWCVEGQQTNPVLAWHGTPEAKIPFICREGLQNLSKADAGWFGKGLYLTQLPNYGEFYINLKRQDYGESVQLLLCWVLMGRAYPVTEKREGSGCEPGYDSHFVLTEGFEPCPLGKEPTGDEIVAFDSAQVLPRYIVRYEIMRRPHAKERKSE